MYLSQISYVTASAKDAECLQAVGSERTRTIFHESETSRVNNMNMAIKTTTARPPQNDLKARPFPATGSTAIVVSLGADCACPQQAETY